MSDKLDVSEVTGALATQGTGTGTDTGTDTGTGTGTGGTDTGTGTGTGTGWENRRQTPTVGLTNKVHNL